MICHRTLPASAISLDACAHRPFPARLPHPANGLLLLNYAFIPMHRGVPKLKTFVLYYYPNLSSALILPHRLSFSITFWSDSGVCSLNLIEPHVGPDRRCTLPVSSGAVILEPPATILATLLPRLATSASAGTHAVVLQAYGELKPPVDPRRNRAPSLRNNTILRLASQKCNHLKSCP